MILVMRARLIATVIAIVGMMGQPGRRGADGVMIMIMTMGMTRGKSRGKGARMHMRRCPNLKAAGRKR